MAANFELYNAIMASPLHDQLMRFISALQESRYLATVSALFFAIGILYFITQRDKPSIFNRLFPFEPSVFARIRWSLWAPDILDGADKKVDCNLCQIDRCSITTDSTKFTKGCRPPI